MSETPLRSANVSHDSTAQRGARIKRGSLSSGTLRVTRHNARIVLAGAALLSLYFVYAAVLPNPIIRSGDSVVRWELYDKRAMVNAYLVAIAFFVFGRFVCAPANDQPHAAEPGRARPGWHRAAWFVLGAGLGVLFFGEGIAAGILKPDSHVDVQLGGIQAIALRRTPYVEALTQYGPGTQLLLYQLMNSIEFSYWGALQAQAVVNIVTLALFCGLLVWFLGPLLGVTCVALLGVFVSPVFVAAYPGWGWLTRWVGCAATALILAELVFGRPQRRGLWAFAALGAAWGAFCFLSQENFATGLLAFGIVLGLAGGLGAISRTESVLCGCVTVAAGLLAFVAMACALIGPRHFPELVHLYTSSSARVAAGISNSPWTASNTRSVLVETAVYHVSWILIPAMVILVSTRGRMVGGISERRSAGQMIGVLGGSAALTVLTLFRADLPHLQGPSFLTGALFACGATILPKVLMVGSRTAKGIATAFGCALALAVLIKVLAGQPASYGVPGTALLGLVGELESAGRQQEARHPLGPEEDIGTVVGRRIGGPRSWRARYPQSVADLVVKLRRELGERRVVIDSTSTATGNLFVYSGLLFFLGDLRVTSSITEPTISIWLSSDYARWQQDLSKGDPDCLVTSATDLEADPMARWFIERYGAEVPPDRARRRDLNEYSVLCRQRRADVIRTGAR